MVKDVIQEEGGGDGLAGTLTGLGSGLADFFLSLFLC